LALVLAAGCLAPSLALADEDGLDLKAYGDVGFDLHNHDAVHSSFKAADFELFLTYSKDRWSFLSEVMFEGDDNSIGIDLERLQATYLVSEALRFKLGRMHTAFGYYNDAFHHGKLFELATGRPYLANFEDGGGLLQAHVTGVAIDGKVPVGPFDFHYDLEVGNGRGHIIDDVTSTDARKDAKVVNLRLRLLPSFAPGLIVGGNVLYDQVPESPTPDDPNAPKLIPHKLHEIDVGAHVAYMEEGWHLLAEGAMMQHREPDTGNIYTSWAGFLEVGHAIGDFTPYVRYEHIAFDEKKDPLYQTGTLANAEVVNDARLGVKWMPTENVAFKGEVGTLQDKVVPTRQTLRLQCAFGF
jgi:hypothetical protein